LRFFDLASSTLVAGRAVDLLPDDVGVPDVPGVLLRHHAAQ
jgi:hypothetical protein